MKCELLAEENLALMLDFIDDENTKYLLERNLGKYILKFCTKALVKIVRGGQIKFRFEELEK